MPVTRAAAWEAPLTHAAVPASHILLLSLLHACCRPSPPPRRYYASAYYLAKSTAEAFIYVAAPVCFSCIAYWMVGLQVGGSGQAVGRGGPVRQAAALFWCQAVSLFAHVPVNGRHGGCHARVHCTHLLHAATPSGLASNRLAASKPFACVRRKLTNERGVTRNSVLPKPTVNCSP